VASNEIPPAGHPALSRRLRTETHTRELPGISDRIAWDDLRTGDIILKPGHVLMFAARRGDYLIGYEAGPIPTWRARHCAILISYLKGDGYSPWRYKNMRPPRPVETEARYEIVFRWDRWRM
jgi:hypothetical protein